MVKLKVLDLFSGIGGFALGLESTGYFKTVQFVENEKWCQKILTKNFPGVPIHDDIKTYNTYQGVEADVVVGGSTGPAVTTATEEYNGETWTGGGALSQARQYFAGTGIESAGLAFGGSSNPNTTIYSNTEEYDGSSWTSGGSMPAVRSMMFSWGTQTAGALSGGALPSTTATCLKYDGTSWASSPASMGTATKQGYTSGVGTTQSAGLCAGGDPAISRTEEFNISTNTITAGAWASGGALPTGVYDNAGAGTQNAGLSFGGDTAPDGKTTSTFEYDGSSWTAQR